MNRRQLLHAMATTPFVLNSLTDVEAFADELPASERMPALFLGHGTPMNAIEDNEFVQGFRDIAKKIPKPQAIVCISAHWYTRGTKVTAMARPRTIHDFYGFPQELYAVEYPAAGDPKLAAEARELLKPVSVELDQQWGLDHGAWSVIKHMYPQADVPVVQVSVDQTQPAKAHYELGQRLDALRDRGVLILGSGNIVHNLRKIDFAGIDRDDYGFDWAVDARNFVNQQIAQGDYTKLLRPEQQGIALRMAIPTPDHYLPLLYVLGTKHQPGTAKVFNDKMVAGSISMTSVLVG
ncbi:4,5-DOPA-extradiol-dioxygenase [Aeoliella mucimassa]|uniref:LigB family dioxygenase n=1 Tax=Aeoliella mucimassa TaxID=2527972 RepID=A0A518AKL4_9BACT|nr:4,5-DOPA dioxygenase extradiol [Aeoliella mucimassa]QDU55278.1 LigB family dioxygenase [Aeoliella mucimassa]